MTLAVLLAAALAAPSSAARLEVRCDARVDVLGVVQALAGRRKASPPLPPSMRDLEERFAAWKDHPAVAAYARTAARLDGSEAYVLILSALTDPPALAWARPRSDLSGDFIARSGGPAELEAFLRDLRDFSRRSGVLDWLKARSGECRVAEHAARAESGGRDPVAALEAYLGKRLDARGLMPLSLIYTPYHYTSYILPYPYPGAGREVKGPFLVFNLLLPRRGEAGRPRFGLDAPFSSALLPEFYYLAAEPAYARHRAAFEARSALHRELGSGCHPSWQACAMHIVVYALNRRVARVNGETPSRDRQPISDAAARLEKRLEEEYEPGLRSGRYKSIDDFWPRLIDALGPAAPGPRRG